MFTPRGTYTYTYMYMGIDIDRLKWMGRYLGCYVYTGYEAINPQVTWVYRPSSSRISPGGLVTFSSDMAATYPRTSPGRFSSHVGPERYSHSKTSAAW